MYITYILYNIVYIYMIILYDYEYIDYFDDIDGSSYVFVVLYIDIVDHYILTSCEKCDGS